MEDCRRCDCGVGGLRGIVGVQGAEDVLVDLRFFVPAIAAAGLDETDECNAVIGAKRAQAIGLELFVQPGGDEGHQVEVSPQLVEQAAQFHGGFGVVGVGADAVCELADPQFSFGLVHGWRGRGGSGRRGLGRSVCGRRRESMREGEGGGRAAEQLEGIRVLWKKSQDQLCKSFGVGCVAARMELVPGAVEQPMRDRAGGTRREGLDCFARVRVGQARADGVAEHVTPSAFERTSDDGLGGTEGDGARVEHG